MKPAAHRVVMASRQATDDEVDFFPTEPWGARAGAELIRRLDPRARSAWDPGCGAGHLVHGLREAFPAAWGSDAYPYTGNFIYDFLGDAPPPWRPEWIVANPPFAPIEQFIQLALQRAGRGVAILGRVALWETLKRHPLMFGAHKPAVFAPFSERLALVKGRWDPDASSAAFYAWFIWTAPHMRRPANDTVVWDMPPGTKARLTRADDAALYGVRRLAA